MNRYDKIFRSLRKQANAEGFKVKFVGNNKLHDYEAMNPEAAREIGYPIGDHTIQIQRGLPPETRARDLNHELIERRRMAKGEEYWPAHKYALKHEGDLPKLNGGKNMSGELIMHNPLRVVGPIPPPEPESNTKGGNVGKLTYRQRQMLPKSAFAIPEKRKYPIENIAHGRNALARVAAFGTQEEKRRVQQAVYTKYPALAPVQVEKVHDDGDLTLRTKSGKHIVLTTEGKTFVEVPRIKVKVPNIQIRQAKQRLGPVRYIPGVGSTRRVSTGRVLR